MQVIKVIQNGFAYSWDNSG